MPANNESGTAERRLSESEVRRVARRDVLKGLAAAAGGGAALACLPRGVRAEEAGVVGYPALAPTTADTVAASDTEPIVEIASGKVRGYVRKGIFTFKGIPYADTTAGANRFMPPQKAKPWTDVRSSMQFGNVCPQPPRAGWADDEVAWMFSWDDGVPGEDCLRVNLWTPAINDGKKRPVMVWLHGGGYTAGSGQELLSYDGENLARRGDVVVVTLNHRLNVFGYLNLAHYGSQYHRRRTWACSTSWPRWSGCVITYPGSAATRIGDDLRAVRRRRQGKALMAMPSANGLFHRAIVESGSLMRGQTDEDSAKLAADLLAKLNLDAPSVGKLQDLPSDEIEAAAVAVTHASHASDRPHRFRHIGRMIGWAPVVDGHVLPRQPFDPGRSCQSANVPLLVGTR